MQATRLFYRSPREPMSPDSWEQAVERATARLDEIATFSAFNRTNNLSRLQRNPHLCVMDRLKGVNDENAIIANDSLVAQRRTFGRRTL